MLPNIDASMYRRFKSEYSCADYKSAPVAQSADIVQLAYLDVNRTMRGIGPLQAFNFKSAGEDFVLAVLRSQPGSQRDFDVLHKKFGERCTAVSAADGAKVHYGQAQKLLNMSMKYLYNEYALYLGQVNPFAFPSNNCESYFHLPIDNQVLNVLTKQCHFTRPTNLPWSQWSYIDYMTFQEQIRRRLNPKYRQLELDYMIWNTKGASVGDAIRP